jgi:hypothetical protein
MMAIAAECAGKTVAQCADALAKTVDELKNENLQLTNKLVAQKSTLEEQAKAFTELTQRIDLLDKKVDAIYQALSFGYGAVTRKSGVVFNGPDDSPRCPSGSVMTGVRHSGYNYENGEIDCVSLKPADVH